jgi:HK97 family phage major capsid protein
MEAVKLTKDEAIQKIADLKRDVLALETDREGQRFTDDEKQRYNEWNEEIDDLEDHVAELKSREDRVAVLAAEDRNRERAVVKDETTRSRQRGSGSNEDIYDLTQIRHRFDDPGAEGHELKERAKRAIDMLEPQNDNISKEDAQQNVSRLVERTDSEDGRFARYVLATGNPEYKKAWWKILPAALRGMPPLLSRSEQQAVEQAQYAERALSLTGASGGFAVPFDLDPTILLTNAGVVDPIRQNARVRTITTDEWRGITSAGITASYAAEAAETTDNAPTLVQPTVTTERAQAFVPFSIEIGQDWTGMQSELSEMFQDAKTTLEAQKFMTGTGTNEPFGVITGATNTVNAAAGQTFTLANLYALKNALPPRYRANAVFMGDLQILDRIRQFDTVGSSAVIWQDSLQRDLPAMLLGKPVYEASEMADTPATAAKFLLYGDFSRYLIIDRVGLGVEVIPHLMGSNRRPTGERGLYMYWRNGAKVIDANAFRVLLGVA